MKIDQSALGHLPAEAADALRKAGSCWDSLVLDYDDGSQIIVMMLSAKGAPVVPSRETRRKWKAFKEALVAEGLMDEAKLESGFSDDRVIKMYRALPARDRMVVGDLVESLHDRL